MGALKKIADFLNISDSLRKSIYPVRIIKIRGVFYKCFLKKCGWGICVDKYVNFQGKKNIIIGDNCVINSFVHIWAGTSGVVIGDRVMIASHTAITTLTHDYNDSNMRFAPAIDKRIIIEDDVWIGSHAVIMPGVVIRKGAVIGAGSVVTKDVEETSQGKNATPSQHASTPAAELFGGRCGCAVPGAVCRGDRASAERQLCRPNHRPTTAPGRVHHGDGDVERRDSGTE